MGIENKIITIDDPKIQNGIPINYFRVFYINKYNYTYSKNLLTYKNKTENSLELSTI